MDEAEEIARRTALRDNFEYYATHVLKIRPKGTDVGVVPLTLNAAQRILHAKAEDMLARMGYVRLLICKGRQQGISTYIGARFFHKTTWRRGIRTYILTHEQPATDNLFGMTGIPDEGVDEDEAFDLLLD